MAISPAEAEAQALRLRVLYAEAQEVVIQLIAARLAQGIDTPLWAEQKNADLRRVRADVEAEIARLKAATSAQVTDVVDKAYAQGGNSGAGDLVEAGFNRDNLVRTNVATGRAFSRELERQLSGTHFAILRQTEDVYRRAVAEGVRGAVGGVETRRQATQRVLDDFANRGVTGFVDKAGRNWSLDSYAEMATRTTLGRAAIQGHIDTLTANGRDLVIISDSPEECPLCRPWEGKVLSLTGKTKRYPTLDEARAGGLFHPSCTHRTGLYTPGLTRPLENTTNAEGYEERVQQRAMERDIRKWKRREAAALDDVTRTKAAAKVKDKQRVLREFVAEHDRKRLYYRESVGTAKVSPAEERRRAERELQLRLEREKAERKERQRVARNERARQRRAAQRGAVQPTGLHSFTGSTAPRRANVTTLSDGVKVMTPADLGPSQLFSANDVVGRWDRLPLKLRQHTQGIELVDYRNPSDAYWEKQYGMPDFRSFATGGGGKITFYENEVYGRISAVKHLDHTLAHEAGHNLDRFLRDTVPQVKRPGQFGTGNRFYSEGPEWAAIRQADIDHNVARGKTGPLGAEPGRFTSDYARRSNAPAEDFADAVAAYVESPHLFRIQYPNRAQYLDGILSPD